MAATPEAEAQDGINRLDQAQTIDEILPFLTGERANHAAVRLCADLRGQQLPAETITQLLQALAASDAAHGHKMEVYEALLDGSDDPENTLLTRVARETGLHRFEWRAAAKAVTRGQMQEVRPLLAPAHAHKRLSPLAASLFAEVLSMEGNNDTAIEVLNDQLAIDPERAETYRNLATIQQRAMTFDASADTIEAALTRWPGDWSLLFRLNRMQIAPDRVARCHALLSDQYATEPRYRFHLAIAAGSAGEFERMADLMQDPFPPMMEPMANGIRRVLAQRSAEDWRRSVRLQDDRTLDCQIVHRTGAEAMVVIPTGVTFGLLPIRMLDVTMAEVNATVVYLRDFRKMVYLKGVASLGSDLPQTLEAMQNIGTTLGATRHIFMGCSSGGFSAFRMAALTGARGISFAGPTDLSVYLEDAKPVAYSQENFHRYALDIREELNKDNRPFLRNPAPGASFLHISGQAMERDMKQTNLLTGLANVDVYTDPSVSDHLVVNHMIADGRFEELIQSEIRGAPWAAHDA